MINVKKTISEEVIDTEVAVGDIIDNRYFDANLDYRIVETEGDGSWTDLYNSREADDDPPSELMIRRVGYLTIGDNLLILEVR